MRSNRVKALLKEGKNVYGSEVSRLRSPEVPRLYAAAGFDFVFIDMEHSAFSLETVADLVQGARMADIVPLVRVPQAEYVWVARVLDLGAQGIIVPRVNTARQAADVVSWTRYPPLGIRGFACTAAQTDHKAVAADAFIEASQRETLCVIQVERQEAVDNLEEMLAVPGVDVACLGYMDLSVDLGIPGQLEHPRMVQAVERLIAVPEPMPWRRASSIRGWTSWRAGLRPACASCAMPPSRCCCRRPPRLLPAACTAWSASCPRRRLPVPVLSADFLLRAVADIFQARGASSTEAAIVAEHLVDAEACGVTSHGLIRVRQYVQALADGTIRPTAKPSVRTQGMSAATADGQHGFGPVMARQAMDLACDIAERTAVGAVTLVNCGHTGRLGHYTERAARRGLASMMMVNAGGHGQWVAPFGGTDGRLATNPISIAVPSDEDPLLLDIATSVAPEGKVRALLTAGRTMPDGWVVNARGERTCNPADLYGPPRGALLPFGGHKGYGLALLVEALAGGLSGAGCCTDPDAPMAGKTDGVFLLAVRIDAFVAAEQFRQTITQLLRHVKSSPPAPGVAEVLTPGEHEARTRRQRLRDGIPVELEVWQPLFELMTGQPSTPSVVDECDAAFLGKSGQTSPGLPTGSAGDS
jgi:hydroxycarboxylate dehydrogenase B